MRWKWMLRALVTVLVLALSGCASNPQKESEVPVETTRHHEGKVIGGAGGALAGGAMAYSSAGLLCTIGGPLCAVVVVPAAILGGIVGLAGGAVVDKVNDSRAKDAPKDEAAPPRADISARLDGSAPGAAQPPPY
jgi:surface antigen